MKKRKSEGEDLWQWAQKSGGQTPPLPAVPGVAEAAGITRHLRGLLLSLGRKIRRPSSRRE
jgi:hypothetical protein